jgi:quercetin dioxygenase-like cupin family protein
VWVRRALVVLILTSFLAGPACGSSGSDDAAPAAGTPTTAVATATTVAPVVRDLLASDADPPGAAGRTLSLVRYTIAPGAQLAPHVHPGVQMASIQAGSLSYTVVSGTATVKRSTGTTEAVAGPATTTLATGDAVIETGNMVHFGANTTGAPIIILAALLTETGLDLAVPPS